MAVLLSLVMGCDPSLADADSQGSAEQAAQDYIRTTARDLQLPLRARGGSFQCLIGSCVGEDIFVSLVEGEAGCVAHVTLPSPALFACAPQVS
jgi:hypothetical protein